MFEKTKTNEKEVGVGPFLKKFSNNVYLHFEMTINAEVEKAEAELLFIGS